MTRLDDPELASLPTRRGRLVRAVAERDQRPTATLEDTRAALESPRAAGQAPRVVPVDLAAAHAHEAETVVELARLLAERVAGRALETSDEALGHFALSLLSESGGSRSLVLFAHPDQAARLRRVLANHDLGERALTVVDDATLAPSELRFETPEGRVHASVAASLETLARVALSRLVRDDDGT